MRKQKLKKSNKKGKLKILLLISGSIAAVRIPLLVSKLVKENYIVKCVITKNAEKIIQPLSLSILSRNKCIIDSDQWNYKKSKPLHISLCEWADILIIAPLTATTLSKWVYGNAEGLVASILIANTKPIIVAPAMNTNMWLNQAVTSNYKKLKTFKNILSLEPLKGLLACDQYGIGKIPTNDLISLAIKFLFLEERREFNDLANKSFLVTGGATTEKIDSARMITNNSSGAMSILLAQVARFRGAKVTYIHGPLKLSTEIIDGIDSYEVRNGSELNNLIQKEVHNHDYFFMNAAVADMKIKKDTIQKVPKINLKDHLVNNLELVPDILKEVSSLKRKNQIFIGFCAYTGTLENLRKTIQQKFEIKGCDYIFANPIDIDGQGFGEGSENEGWLFDKKELECYFEKSSKLDLANKLINRIISIDK
tara:strand:+ start:101 stop:1369 length:1269 start_codon:yes stop_codon:yes gene_type:complete